MRDTERLSIESKSSPLRRWLLLAVLAVLKCAPGKPVKHPMSPETIPTPADTAHLDIIKRGIYDTIAYVCGQAKIPVLKESAAKHPELFIEASEWFRIELPPNRGDGSEDDFYYSVGCGSDGSYFDEIQRRWIRSQVRKMVISRFATSGRIAPQLLEQWHVVDARYVPPKHRSKMPPIRLSQYPPVVEDYLPRGPQHIETFPPCSDEDYAALLDSVLCPTVESIDELNK